MSTTEASATLESLPVHHQAFSYAPETQLVALGEGFNSRVFQVGSHVVKISKACADSDAMFQHAAVLKREEEMVGEYLGDYLPPTMYMVAPSSERPEDAHVVTIQNFVRGADLADFLKNDQVDHGILVGFLENCLRMYDETGKIPDIANVQTGFSFYRNHNVIVSTAPETAGQPFLVDTNFGKTQRSRALGSLWHRQIARGARRALRSLG